MGPPNAQLAGVRVLVVDDDADEREMLTFVLEYHGADVTAVASAEAAVAVVVRDRPDVLVSDICLPQKDGYRLVEEIRLKAPEDGGRIPAVALTGWNEAIDCGRAIAAGFQVHLAKPVSLDTLVAVLTGLARASRALGAR